MKKYLLIFLLFISCGPVCVENAEQPFHQTYKRYPVYIDPGNVNPESINQAISFWNLEGELVVEKSIKAPIKFFKAETLPQGSVGRAVNVGPYCVIFLLDDDWDTAAHEIGHCLGFQHTEDVCSIMYKDESRAPEMTEKIKSEIKTLLDYHSNANYLE